MAFTTPLLRNARARPSQRGNIELILPTPTGERGVYVLACENVQGFCRLTLHDQQLILHITALPTITPMAIRRVARAIAAEGTAGEAAMEAALASIDASKEELVAANYRLLISLIDRDDILPIAAFQEVTTHDLEVWTQKAVDRIALHIDKSAGWVTSNLETLAEVLYYAGISPRSKDTQILRMLGLLRDVRAEIFAWSRNQDNAEIACYADMICAVADVTLTLATKLVEPVRVLTDDPVRLLRTWATDPKAVIQATSRLSWLLDGWSPICLLWRQVTDPVARRTALVEIAQLVPVLRDFVATKPL